MNSKLIEKAIFTMGKYLNSHYTKTEISEIQSETEVITGEKICFLKGKDRIYTHKEMQNILSGLNEKESIRKIKGVYYTPQDVTRFILMNSFKLASGELNPENLHNMQIADIQNHPICYNKIVFDPTCGTGEFLLTALEIKLDLLADNHNGITKDEIFRVVKTIKGNDINKESTMISKLRILLFLLERYGVNKILGIGEVLKVCFSNYDYVCPKKLSTERYDIIVGNPPYVEDSKSGLNLKNSFGNIYANVLYNASCQLNDGGVIGFIIPISYVSTLRMKKIRNILYETVPEQYIMNYSDRPDCLFTSVHQKLSILLARNTGNHPRIYTGNYTYWYSEEREKLFSSTAVTRNHFVEDSFIPKIGTEIDSKIYHKIISNKYSINELFDGGEYSI